MKWGLAAGGAGFLVLAGAAALTPGKGTAAAQQAVAQQVIAQRVPQSCPAPVPVTPMGTCHPSACTPGLCSRGDIAPLCGRSDLMALQDRLILLDCSPHSIPPLQIFAEADQRSQLFQYYLLETEGFEPNVFTARIPGVNDKAMLTATGGNCGLSTLGAVRLALEPKPGLPTDPDNPRAFIDVFTDIRGLFVINNEGGWYEGWMIHDLRVAPVAPPDAQGHAVYGTITAADARALARMGTGNNAVAGRYFTVDGNAPRFPSASDHFPTSDGDRATKLPNIMPIQLSMGAYNALQQSDAHNYWEFNYTTNWIHPLYELPYTGGFPDVCPTEAPETYLDGEIGALQSIVPGDGPGENREPRDAVRVGDDPNLPRDADKFDADVEAQREFRQRFIPSGLAREVFLDVFERPASFRPDLPACGHLQQRLFAAYQAAIACVDTNHDGIVSASEGDIDTASCGFANNERLFLVPRTFDRFAVTREINDGMLAPRFAPSTRAWVLTGQLVTGFPMIGASEGRDSDDR